MLFIIKSKVGQDVCAVRQGPIELKLRIKTEHWHSINSVHVIRNLRSLDQRVKINDELLVNGNDGMRYGVEKRSHLLASLYPIIFYAGSS